MLNDHAFQNQEILYLKAEGSSTVVYMTENRKICLSSNMLQVRDAMNNPHIIHIHRSYCINLHKNPTKKDSFYHLDDGSCIPISRRKFKTHLSGNDDWENFQGTGTW